MKREKLIEAATELIKDSGGMQSSLMINAENGSKADNKLFEEVKKKLQNEENEPEPEVEEEIEEPETNEEIDDPEPTEESESSNEPEEVIEMTEEEKIQDPPVEEEKEELPTQEEEAPVVEEPTKEEEVVEEPTESEDEPEPEPEVDEEKAQLIEENKTLKKELEVFKRNEFKELLKANEIEIPEEKINEMTIEDINREVNGVLGNTLLTKSHSSSPSHLEPDNTVVTNEEEKKDEDTSKIRPPIGNISVNKGKKISENE